MTLGSRLILYTVSTDGSAIYLALGPDGNLYVLEIFTGRVVCLSHGKRTVVVDTGADLTNPSGLAISKDGSIYVRNCGTCPGTGTVVRFLHN